MAHLSEVDIEKEGESLRGVAVISLLQAADFDRTLRGRGMTPDRTPACKEPPV